MGEESRTTTGYATQTYLLVFFFYLIMNLFIISPVLATFELIPVKYWISVTHPVQIRWTCKIWLMSKAKNTVMREWWMCIYTGIKWLYMFVFFFNLSLWSECWLHNVIWHKIQMQFRLPDTISTCVWRHRYRLNEGRNTFWPVLLVVAF